MRVALPSEWRMVRLGACLTRRTETVMPATLTVDRVNVVGLEDIEDAGRGGISILRKRPSEIESLKTIFHKGDILYGRLRPYLNKVGITSDGGLCSTEIWAFAPESFVDAYFAYAFLSSSFFVQRVSSLTKGANLPRLSIESFESVEIPLPPLSEQRRIAQILREAEEIRRLRSIAEAKTSTLIPAIFNSGFDSHNTHDYEPLETLADVVSGVTIGRTIRGGGIREIPYLRVANVQTGYVDLGEVKTTEASEREIKELRLLTGDVLMTEGGDFDKLGRGSLWEGEIDPCIHQNHVFRVRPHTGKLHPQFLTQYLQTAHAKHYFLRCAKRTTNLASINLTQLKKLPVPKIPFQLQEELAAKIALAKACVSSEAGHIESLLFSSLLTQAFTGDLTAEWRERQKDMLRMEVLVRDGALKAIGAATTEFITTEDIETSYNRRDDGVYAELSWEQHVVLEAVERTYGGSTYPRWFNAEEIAKSLNGPLRGNRHAVGGHLAVLAARGLVIAVSREEASPATGEIVFGNAYRLPLANFDPLEGDAREPVVGDHARLREMERLVQHLEKKRTS